MPADLVERLHVKIDELRAALAASEAREGALLNAIADALDAGADGKAEEILRAVLAEEEPPE